jgi:hypothetical protein
VKAEEFKARVVGILQSAGLAIVCRQLKTEFIVRKHPTRLSLPNGEPLQPFLAGPGGDSMREQEVRRGSSESGRSLQSGELAGQHQAMQICTAEDQQAGPEAFDIRRRAVEPRMLLAAAILQAAASWSAWARFERIFHRYQWSQGAECSLTLTVDAFATRLNCLNRKLLQDPHNSNQYAFGMLEDGPPQGSKRQVRPLLER